MDTLEKQSYDFLIDSTIITTDAKKLLTIHPFKNIYDINILNWWIDNKPLSGDVKNNAIDYMNNKYYNMKNVNYIIPSVKHLEWCDEVSKNIEQVWAKKDTIDFENYKQYNEEVVVAFTLSMTIWILLGTWMRAIPPPALLNASANLTMKPSPVEFM